MFEEDASQQHYHETTGTPRWIALTFAVLAVVIAVLSYVGYSRLEATNAALSKKSADLAGSLLVADNRINTLQAQLEATGRKVGMTQKDLAATKSRAEEIKKEQEAANQQLTGQINQVATDATTKIGTVQSNVDTTNQNLEATKKDITGQLTAMKGDEGVMSGLIARNHDDLDSLRQRGERNYFEFAVTKSKLPSRVGPVQLRLKSADPKRSKYTIVVTVDDRTIEKPDKTAGEPVQFYVKGARNLPYELVVFEVAKDKISGYLSTPKVAN